MPIGDGVQFECPFECAALPPVVVGCSGGADSTALLALAADAGLAPVAVHVDHGLRAGSADEAGVVAAVAARLGTGFRAVCVTIEPGPNLEARARDARYAALEDVRADVGASAVLVGHTADDQCCSTCCAAPRPRDSPVCPRPAAGSRGLCSAGDAPTRTRCAPVAGFPCSTIR